MSAVRRNAVRIVIIVIVAIAAVVLIAWIGGAFDSDEETPPTTVLPIETLPSVIPSTSVPGTSELPDSTAPTTPVSSATAVTTAAP